MTIDEMIDKLQVLKDTGLGELELLFQDKDEYFGWAFSGKYQVGHCDPEGYVWHSLDVNDAIQLEGYQMSKEPDVIIFS
jgi:hypothetical protein